jgi:hypothetical protein
VVGKYVSLARAADVDWDRVLAPTEN